MDSEKRAELVSIAKQLVGLLSEDERRQVLSSALDQENLIPISVFRSRLSCLEAITLYLKDEKKLSTREAADLLRRNPSTIYTTYQNAKKKFKGSLDCSDFSITIPLDVFADRRFSILESLVAYLRENKEMTLVKIAALLGKSYSTVKTTYRRYQDKCR